ncbi:hypothetical protein EDB86DRAFT_2834155 [Lactarius hatsudake]|nr:hypothetical protein EDB86DRAFT_2834155 [Lactarius hatsudake]
MSEETTLNLPAFSSGAYRHNTLNSSAVSLSQIAVTKIAQMLDSLASNSSLDVPEEQEGAFTAFENFGMETRLGKLVPQALPDDPPTVVFDALLCRAKVLKKTKPSDGKANSHSTARSNVTCTIVLQDERHTAGKTYWPSATRVALSVMFAKSNAYSASCHTRGGGGNSDDHVVVAVVVGATVTWSLLQSSRVSWRLASRYESSWSTPSVLEATTFNCKLTKKGRTHVANVSHTFEFVMLSLRSVYIGASLGEGKAERTHKRPKSDDSRVTTVRCAEKFSKINAKETESTDINEKNGGICHKLS